VDALVAVAEAFLWCPSADADATQQATAGAPASVELVVHVDEATLLADPRDQTTSSAHNATHALGR
jgi:hypothetical protein